MQEMLPHSHSPKNKFYHIFNSNSIFQSKRKPSVVTLACDTEGFPIIAVNSNIKRAPKVSYFRSLDLLIMTIQYPERS